MRSKTTRTLVNAIGSLFIIVCLMQMTACSRKQIAFFQSSFDTSKYTSLAPREVVIQKNDILSITVYSDDAGASALYNQAIATGTTGNTGAVGYLVSEQGDIQFQGVGRLHVEGLTKLQLSALLNERLKEKLKNPYYVIRFLNYRVIVQGEVNRSGELLIPNERVTILEAIALAGDVTIYAKKDDVLLIREMDGKRDIVRLDLRDPNIFNSPYYYLKQNDLIIVQPTRKKPSAERQEIVQNIGLSATLVSMAVVIYSLFRK